MNRTVLIWILIIFSNTAFGQVIPKDAHKQVIDIAMKNYWGKARLEDGSYVRPQSEKERDTVPITLKIASEVIRVGELSSLADWCGLKWQENYRSVTNGARSDGLSGKQVAFVGLLHGVSMGFVDRVVEGKACSPEQKESIEIQLKNISNKSINFAPSVPDS